MSDFEKLKMLQDELIRTLEERIILTDEYRSKREKDEWCSSLIPRSCCKAKIQRLRLQIQEVMLRIERSIEGSFYSTNGGEPWMICE